MSDTGMTSGTAAHGADAEPIARRFEALPGLVAADTRLIDRGRFLTVDWKIGIGPLALLVSVERGRVASVARGPFLLRPWAFALTAPAEVWRRFLEPIPAPGFHDILALSKAQRLSIEGNLQPLMANLQYVKDVLALARAHGTG